VESAEFSAADSTLNAVLAGMSGLKNPLIGGGEVPAELTRQFHERRGLFQNPLLGITDEEARFALSPRNVVRIAD
jgi:hypothetical protein